MAAKLKVEGVPEVTRALDEVQREIADLSEAHLTEADMLLSEVVGRTRVKSGNLAAHWQTDSDATNAQFLNDLEYAGVQEFGWSARNIDPTHAIQGAFESKEEQTERVYADAIAKIGERANFTVRR